MRATNTFFTIVKSIDYTQKHRKFFTDYFVTFSEYSFLFRSFPNLADAVFIIICNIIDYQK